MKRNITPQETEHIQYLNFLSQEFVVFTFVLEKEQETEDEVWVLAQHRLFCGAVSQTTFHPSYTLAALLSIPKIKWLSVSVSHFLSFQYHLQPSWKLYGGGKKILFLHMSDFLIP